MLGLRTRVLRGVSMRVSKRVEMLNDITLLGCCQTGFVAVMKVFEGAL